MRSPIALGIDIGGSHITAALINIETKTLLSETITRKMVNAKESAETILDAWCEVINHSYQGYEAVSKHIGVAMPGPFDYENGICLIEEQDKFRALFGLNLKAELAVRLGIPTNQIHFINDAAGFLQGEIFTGSAGAASRVLGFTLGTGLGSAICINGKAVDAGLWNAPFLGYMAEDYLSTKWFVKRYEQLSGKMLAGVKELADCVAADPHAMQIFNEFGVNFAQFIMPLVDKHQATVVILGGNIAQAFRFFSPSLMNVLAENQFETDIKLSKLNEHAALIGAASNCL
jgi:glucokinase